MVRTATSVWDGHSVRLSANSPQKGAEYKGGEWFVVRCLWIVVGPYRERPDNEQQTTHHDQSTKKESFRRGVEAFCFVSRPQVGAKAQNV